MNINVLCNYVILFLFFPVISLHVTKHKFRNSWSTKKYIVCTSKYK
jgi:hypothetical protein